MKFKKSYVSDLIKSYNTPLLLELNKKDLSYLKEDAVDELVLLTGNVFNKYIETDFKGETNLIYINGDNFNYNNNNANNPIILLNSILSITSDSIQTQKNINIVKSVIKGTLSYFTGGLLKDSISKHVDYGIDQLSDLISDSGENISEYASEQLEIDFSKKLSDEILNKVHNTLNESSSNLLDEMLHKKLHLSIKGKKKLDELSIKFNKDLTAVGIFTLIVELILALALDTRKIIFINNPHKLDSDSLAILSLLFSFAKDFKNKDTKNNHLGVSVVYCYSDDEFQPYQELKDNKYLLSKKLLDEQRRFTQRYAMIERPSSDIPNIAVKSSTFVGRSNELQKLMERFNISKKDRDLKNLEIVLADPGIGKTKLIERHIKQIRESSENGQRIIQLTLLNQVGHSSTNTGLTSLKDSILKEANRLSNLKTIESKLKKLEEKAFKFAKDKIVDVIEDLLGVNNLIDIAKNIDTAVNYDVEKYWLKQKSSEDLNNKDKSSKEQEFENIIEAILELQKLSNKTLPVVLFIDDTQWIDDNSAEFILRYFTKTWMINSYIVATQRESDTYTSLKLAFENKSFNEYKISFLQQSEIQGNELLDKSKDVPILNTKIHNLNGLNIVNLTELISLTINTYQKNRSEDLKEKDIVLAKKLVKYLNDESAQSKEVNTLFAIETINILCDKKFYNSNKITPVILQNPLRYDEDITNFNDSLISSFDFLKNSYEKAFEHLDWEKDEDGQDIQKFNLMAYAVLEERLHILAEYFGEEYGDTAVNTLLLSSFIGAPFRSDIVKSVIEKIQRTEEPLLKPLKEVFNKQGSNTLEVIHYDIIEEVYQILSRYIPIKNAYSYKHNLLEIFLDKQFIYKIYDIYKNLDRTSKEKVDIQTNDVLKNIYDLIIEKIKDEISIILKSAKIKNIYCDNHLLKENNQSEEFEYLNILGYKISKKLYNLTNDHKHLISFMQSILYSKPTISYISDDLLNSFLASAKEVLDNTNNFKSLDVLTMTVIFEEMSYSDGYYKLLSKYNYLTCEEEYEKAFFITPLLKKLLDERKLELFEKYSDIVVRIFNETKYIKSNDESTFYDMVLFYHYTKLEYFFITERYEECISVSSEFYNENLYNLRDNKEMCLEFYSFGILSLLKIGTIENVLDVSLNFYNSYASQLILFTNNSEKIEFNNQIKCLLGTAIKIYSFLKELSIENNEITIQLNNYYSFLDKFANEVEYLTYNNDLKYIIHKINFNILVKDTIENTNNELDVAKIIAQYEDSPSRNIKNFLIEINNIITYGNKEKHIEITKYLLNNIENIPLENFKAALGLLIILVYLSNYDLEDINLNKLKTMIKNCTENEEELFTLILNLNNLSLKEIENQLKSFISNFDNFDYMNLEVIETFIYIPFIKLIYDSVEENFILDSSIINHFFLILSTNEIPNINVILIKILDYYMFKLNYFFKHESLSSADILVVENILIHLIDNNINLEPSQFKNLSEFTILVNKLLTNESLHLKIDAIVNLMLTLNLISKKDS